MVEHPGLADTERGVEGAVAFSHLLSAEDRRCLMAAGRVRSVAAGEVLCRQHEVDDRAFIIVLGEVEVVEQVGGRRVVLARLGRGELFGEIAALFGLPRVTDVVVTRPAVLLEIDGRALDELIISRSRLRHAIMHRCRHRITATALRSVAPFRDLPPPARERLAAGAAWVTHAPGSDIVREGEPGDALYVVLFGAARVTVPSPEAPVNLALLRPGEYFGEWAVLTGAPRAATVTAVTQVEVLRVEREAFLALADDHPEVRLQVEALARRRHEALVYSGAHPQAARAAHQVLASIEQAVRGQRRHLCGL